MKNLNIKNNLSDRKDLEIEEDDEYFVAKKEFFDNEYSSLKVVTTQTSTQNKDS